MKKFLSVSMAFLLLLLTMIPAFQYVYAESIITVDKLGEEPKKAINIVYDDSGSMVNGQEDNVTNESAYVATWAQAKYSLEVLIAMMNDDDILNIYCMSDAGGVSKTIKGKDKDGGVSDIHSNMKTGDYSQKTPIQTLKSAYDGLNDSSYDEYERWLVILTDGAFTVSNTDGAEVNKSEVEKLIYLYGSKLNNHLIYIPIGSSANDYSGDTYKTFKATSGEEILNKIEEAAEYIYGGRDKLPDSLINPNGSINLGVSMRKIIIFAQGQGVEIDSISRGKITDNISVKYTDPDDAVNYNGGKITFQGNEDKIKTDESLQGIVVTIEPNGDCIEPGQFNIGFGEIAPKEYAVYFEPAVKAYYSLEKDGVEYLLSESKTSEGSLNPGTYKLTAYIADAFQKDGDIPRNVSDAIEIQDIAFNVILSGSGIEGGKQEFSSDELKNGAVVHLQRGDIQCDASASILSGKYNVDTDDLTNAFAGIKVKDTYRLEVDYEIPTASILSFKFKKTNFILHSMKKLKNEKDLIKAVVSCYDTDGNKVDISDEQWSKVNAQTLKLYFNDNIIYDENSFNFHTENGCGIFYLKPQYYRENDKESKKKTTHSNHIHRKRMCNVRSEVYIDVSDSLAFSTLGSTPEQKSSSYEIALGMWHTIIPLFIFFWILFCIVKKRLPKVKSGQLLNNECYTYEMNRRGKWEWVKAEDYLYNQPSTVYIEKKMNTVLFPFIPQKGEIKLGSGFPKLKIEATEVFGKRSKVKLLNNPSSFEAINGKTTLAEDSQHIAIKGVNITKEFLESKKKKKFEFSTSQSLITFGGNDGGVFRRYSLIFKRKKKGNKK